MGRMVAAINAYTIRFLAVPGECLKICMASLVSHIGLRINDQTNLFQAHHAVECE